ncbi:MAG: tetratricopeptide repeat protein [Rhabdochlamydiaceae bacterium]|jgi:tetratricopeptide (TPR) repeat protein
MTHPIGDTTFTIDYFVSICDTGTGLLFQQSAKIVELFKCIIQEGRERSSLLATLSWTLAPSFADPSEAWIFSSSLDPDGAAFWKQGNNSLHLCYNADKSLVAELQKDGEKISIPHNCIYIHWGIGFERLIPRIYREGDSCSLYLTDCLDNEKRKIICGDPKGIFFQGKELPKALSALENYLKLQRQANLLPADPSICIRILESFSPIEPPYEQTLERLFSQIDSLAKDNPQNWPAFKILLPHAETALQHAEKIQPSRSVTLSLAKLAGTVGEGLHYLGNANEALKYSLMALKIRLELLGEEHLDTATSYNNVGLSLGALGRHQEALEHKQKALEIRLKVLQEEHLDTAISYNNVGFSLGALGRHQEALKNEQEALQILLKVLGGEHLNTATSYNNVGCSLSVLGLHGEALKNQQKALEIRRKVLKEEHPDTATSYNNVGLSLRALGLHAEALQHAQKALQIWCKALEEAHPNIATGYNNVGLSLGALGRHQEALEHQQKALKIRCKVLGEKHTNTAQSYNNVGVSLGALGRHQEALRA